VVHSKPREFDPRTLSKATVRWDTLPYKLRRYFVENPTKDPRLVKLAEEIIDVSGAETSYQQAVAVQRWLELNCTYTRLPGVTKRSPSQDPIMTFLFETRKGHCEYFATAQVLLCRALRIPARVVSGFRSGEWNGPGQFYLVRQRNAHSWAEVYFDEIGWHPMDPSPWTAERERFEQSGPVDTYMAFAQSLWDRFVVGYTPKRLGLGYGSLGHSLFDFQSDLRRSANSFSMDTPLAVQDVLGKVVLGLFGVAAVLLVLGLLFRLRLKRWPSLAPRARQKRNESKIPFFRDTLKLLRRRGFERPTGETPHEFCVRVVTQAGDDFEPSSRLTEFYYAARYANRELTSAEIREARLLLGKLRKAKRRDSDDRGD